MEVPFQGSCSVRGIISVLNNIILRVFRKLYLDIAVGQTFIQVTDQKIHDTADIIPCQRLKHDNLIQPVQKFRPEGSTQILHDQFLTGIADLPVLFNPLQKIPGAEVGGHDDDRILKVHSSALGIGDTSVIQNLEQDVEYIRMCFFHLIKEDDRIRFAPYGLGQLSALIISDISRRRPNQPGDRILLHIFAHINPYHILFIVKQAFRKSLRKLGLADTCGSQEQEGADRLCRVLDSCLGTQNGIGHFVHTFLLPDDPLMELIRKIKRLVPFSLGQLCDRYTCPAGYDPGDLLLADIFMDKLMILLLQPFLLRRKLPLQLRKLTVF